MKKIVILLLVLAVLFGGYYYFNNYTTLLSSARSLQNPNTSTLSSETCALSLQYPKEWTGSVNEGPNRCMFKIEDPQNELNFMYLNPVFNTTWKDILTQNPAGTPVSIDGAEGIETMKFDEDGIANGGVYFQKGNVIYSVGFLYQEDDPQNKERMEEIIRSITFTGTTSDYSKPMVDDVEQAENQARDLIIEKDFQNLDSALTQYHTQYKAYPTELTQLQNAGYMREMPQNPYTNTIYEYSSTGQSFTLSATKSDGTPVTISR